jgi:uncharacterized surface protein with fasciclin (FAS1) repeats
MSSTAMVGIGEVCQEGEPGDGSADRRAGGATLADMSNEDVPQPEEAAPGGTPPPPPPPPGPPADPGATQPLEVDDTPASGDPAAGGAGEPPLIVPLDVPSGPGDVTASPPVTDPTAVVGATSVMGAVPDDGLPPIPPAGDPYADDLLAEDEPETPWYKRPGPIAAIVVAVLALGGLLAWLLLSGDDDEVPSTASRLVLETVDQNGVAIARDFVVDVRGPAGAEQAFVWLRPATAPAGTAAVVSSGSNGRAAVDWEPDDSVADPAAWASTVTVTETVPAGSTPPQSPIQCDLERSEGDDSEVQLDVAVDQADPTVQRVATYTFPNHQFLPGDAVTCRLVSAIAGPATTVETTTATTEAATTVPATTESPATTEAPSTSAAATTTTSIDIPPPTPSQTLWDVIEAEDELSEFRAIVEAAGLRDELDDPTRTFTIFAPTNAAIEAARDAGELPSDDDDVTDLLLAHANGDEALEQQDLLLLPEIEVLFGGPQPITAAPPTVGGAQILFQVPPAENGVLYLIDEVLTPVAP